MRYNRSLDGLRAVAVLLVLWSHFPKIDGIWLSGFFSDLGDLVGVGYFGVDLFFVLSGFLITSILLNEKKIRNNIDFKFFYLKRSLRILPIYFLTLLFCWLVIGPVNHDVSTSLFYVSNFYFVFDETGGPLRHTWSLAVEEQFYVFWPVIVLVFNRYALERMCRVWIPIIVFLLSVYACFVWDPELGPRMLYRGTPFRMLSLGFGGLIAVWAVSIKPPSSSVKTGVFFVALAFLIGALFFESKGLVQWSSITKMYGFSLLSFAVVLNIVFGFEYYSRLFERVLSLAPLVAIGKISYGLYLYHAVILYYFGMSKYQIQSVHLYDWLSALAVTVIISILSFHVFEKRMTALKFLYVQNKRPAAGSDDVRKL